MNNSKKVSTKITSAIFLAIVLVTGTISALSSQSSLFMIGAEAQPYFGGMDNRHNYYEPDYGIDNNDRKSYENGNGYESQYQPSYKPDYKPKYQLYDEKDDRRDKSNKDSIVDINKLNCINTNLNINGENTGNVNIGNKGAAKDSGYVGGGYSSSDGSGYGNEERHYDGYNKNNKKDNGFDCIINNNNINVNTVGGNVTDGNITDACEECFNVNGTLKALIEVRLVNLKNDFTLSILTEKITIPGEVDTIEQLCPLLEGHTDFFINNLIALLVNNGVNNGFPGTSNEASIDALVECLLKAGVVVEATAG